MKKLIQSYALFLIRLYNLAFDRLTGGNQNAKIPG